MQYLYFFHSMYFSIRFINSSETVVTKVTNDKLDAKSNGHFSTDAHSASPLNLALLVTLSVLKLLVWVLLSYHHFLLFLSVFLFALLLFMCFRVMLLSFLFD